MSKLVKRILVAAALIVVVGLLLYVNGWALAAGFVILAVMAEYEMAKAVSAKETPFANRFYSHLRCYYPWAISFFLLKVLLLSLRFA